MKLYLANIESWTFPSGGSEILREHGFDVGGNWLDPPFHRELEQFSPDVVVYAPHRRADALVLQKRDILRTPTVLWALYPDYLTGWDREKNEHVDSFLASVAELMPYIQALGYFHNKHGIDRLKRDEFIRVFILTDSRGRCRVLVPEDGSVLIRTDEAFALVSLSAKSRQVVQLKAMLKVEGQILDRKDRPIPKAHLLLVRAGGNTRSPFASVISTDNVMRLNGSTDAHGRFKLRFIPLQGHSYYLRAYAHIAGRSADSGKDLFIVSAEAITDATITLDIDVKEATRKK